MDNIGAYCELERLGVKVGAFKFEEAVALSGPEGYLAIDYSKIECEAHELEVLLHEIGHFATGSFYQSDTPFTDREKQECRATRYVFEKYYPPEPIAEAMAEGDAEPWELAEVFGLPERFVCEMLQFYTEARGVDFDALVDEITAAPDESGKVAALLDELARTRGIHMIVTDDATVDDILESVCVVDEFKRKRGASGN